MKLFKPVAGFALAVALFGASQANFTYNVIASSVLQVPSMTTNPVPFLTSGPMNNYVDHLTGAAGAVAGDGTGVAASIVTIIYEVDTNGKGPVNHLDISILGAVFGHGRIFWSEVVEDMSSNVLLSVGHTFKGSAYSGGSDGAIFFTGSYNLSHAVNQFKVKKTFVLDIGNQPLPSASFAALALVEQNWVPEPASMIALGTGLVGLMVRRRRHSK